MIRADARAIADHLRFLYGGDGGDAPGVAVAFTLPDRRAISRRGNQLFGEFPDSLAALAETMDVYVGLGLQRRAPPAGGRGDTASVIALPGLWFDLDVAGPNHKTEHLPQSRLEALDFLATLPFQPSLVIDSGGGLQVHWLFQELAVFGSDTERKVLAALSEAFQRTVIALGVKRGWKLDNTADLARILRPAGTINHKNGERRSVRTLWCSDARYAPSDFDAFASLSMTSAGDTRAHIETATRGESMRTVIGREKARGRSSAEIADALDRRVRRYLEAVGQRAEGDRDNTAFRVAAWLLNDFGATESVASAYLHEWNQHNDPPLPARELAQKLRSAKRSAQRPIGCAHADHRGSAA